MSPAAVYFIAAEHIQFQTVYERMWAKHHLFVINTDTGAVWRLTIVIRTGNIKTEDQYWMNFISWKCWTGKRRVMALHDILIAFSIISDHSTLGGGTIPRHGQCGPTVAAALPSLVPRLAHHLLAQLHLPTTPPVHFSRRGSPCRVRFRRILLYSSSSVSRYHAENCNLRFIIWSFLWTNQILQ